MSINYSISEWVSSAENSRRIEFKLFWSWIINSQSVDKSIDKLIDKCVDKYDDKSVDNSVHKSVDIVVDKFEFITPWSKLGSS